MILDVAILTLRPGSSSDFEAAFGEAQAYLVASPGYISHELRRCVEVQDRYLLLVRWRTLEDHTEGFRGSEGYQYWRSLLHHFYNPFPIVEHYELVLAGQA